MSVIFSPHRYYGHNTENTGKKRKKMKRGRIKSEEGEGELKIERRTKKIQENQL